jgi:hypothetical protein
MVALRPTRASNHAHIRGRIAPELSFDAMPPIQQSADGTRFFGACRRQLVH